MRGHSIAVRKKELKRLDPDPVENPRVRLTGHAIQRRPCTGALRNRLKSAAGKPPRRREALAARGQDLVVKPLAEQAHESASHGKHVLERLLPRLAQVEPQGTPVVRPPVPVQVETYRDDAAVVVFEAIEMATIACSGRIDREVGLEIEETESELPVQRLAQLLHELEVAPLRRRRPRRIEPAHVVLAYVGSDLPLLATADSRAAELTGVEGRTRLLRPERHFTSVEEVGLNRVAPLRDRFYTGSHFFKRAEKRWRRSSWRTTLSSVTQLSWMARRSPTYGVCPCHALSMQRNKTAVPASGGISAT